MAEATLGIWLVTSIGGAYMWSFTTGVGRPESTARASNLPAWALFVHPMLALGGLGVWIAYLYYRSDVLPWVAFVDLLLVSLVGDLLLHRTFKSSPVPVRAVHDPAMSDHENQVANRTRAEDLIPRPVIVGHGVLAVLTIVLVFLVAVGLG